MTEDSRWVGLEKSELQDRQCRDKEDACISLIAILKCSTLKTITATLNFKPDFLGKKKTLDQYRAKLMIYLEKKKNG